LLVVGESGVEVQWRNPFGVERLLPPGSQGRRKAPTLG
jgi:hypothetical protein